MHFFALIAQLINGVLNAISAVGFLNKLSNNLPSTTVTETKRTDQGDFTPDNPDVQKTLHGRCKISIPETINPNARFHSTGSSAWRNQFPNTSMAGQHGGTDFTGPQGTAVYAPWDMTIIATGHYNDEGRFGDYVIGTPDHDKTLEFYSGHLDNVRVSTGDHITCGTQLGKMNLYNHTHIQIKRNGQVIDPESVLT